MQLLEREASLAQLHALFDGVRSDAGACVLVHGEAGIGKTSLLQAFVRSLDRTRTQLLIAGCEALFTARPLGPLVDLAERFPPSVALALHEGATWNGLFPKLLAFLRESPRPTLLAIEDLHWADAATLDFVRYVGRRLHDVGAMLLLTYRSDELDAEHPLRRVLGELPAAMTTRLPLARLSPAAVTTLAMSRGRSTHGLYDATAGNPFYVTEVLASDADSVPASIADAVLGRCARLQPATREVAELASMFPGHVDVALLRAIAPQSSAAIDACLQVGLLVAQDRTLAFRHELARVAVHASLLPSRRASLHAAVFAALRGSSDDDALARQVHHAEGAGLVDEVLTLAPRAARYAAASGAHREAARLYALALRDGTRLDPARRAALLEAHALACALTGSHAAAIGALREALALRRELGDRRAEGIDLRWLARLHGWSDSLDAAFDHVRAAIEVLEALPPDGELALAYSTLAHLSLVSDGIADAERWGSKAIALAESVGDVAALSQSLNHVANARLRFADDAEAWQMLQRSLDIALAARLHNEAALAFNNLHIMSQVHRRYARALEHADSGIAYCEAHGIDVFAVRMRIRRAYALLQLGRWADAEAELAEVRQHHVSPMEQATRDFVHALLEVRRGGADAQQRLASAAAAMRERGVRIWFTSIDAACAEAAWLRGDADAVRAAAADELQRARAIGDPWRAGELAAWLHRAGHTVPLDDIDATHALELQRRCGEAAAAWDAIGCPYEAALSLLGSDDEALLRDALQRCEALGAAPAAQLARDRLRALGARGVRRGPQPRTRSDPLGFTAREREVFELLLQAKSNAAIAAALHRSERTVEHHVAAVFAKLGVGTRAELVARFAGTTN